MPKSGDLVWNGVNAGLAAVKMKKKGGILSDLRPQNAVNLNNEKIKSNNREVQANLIFD